MFHKNKHKNNENYCFESSFNSMHGFILICVVVLCGWMWLLACRFCRMFVTMQQLMCIASPLNLPVCEWTKLIANRLLSVQLVVGWSMCLSRNKSKLRPNHTVFDRFTSATTRLWHISLHIIDAIYANHSNDTFFHVHFIFVRVHRHSFLYIIDANIYNVEWEEERKNKMLLLLT